MAQWASLETATIREWATDAIRYWEPRRILYNLVLAAIVLTYFAMGLPATKGLLTVNFVLMLFLLAVLANVAYSTSSPKFPGSANCGRECDGCYSPSESRSLA